MTMEIGKSYCCHIVVRDLLSRPDKYLKKWRGAFVMGNGSDCRADTVDEIRNVLFDQLALGREVLPVGHCENFDYKRGCQGHVTHTGRP